MRGGKKNERQIYPQKTALKKKSERPPMHTPENYKKVTSQKRQEEAGMCRKG